MADETVFAPEPPASPRLGPGSRLSDIYEIDSLLGVGGMGEVFKGHAIETGDLVAIKTIRPEMAQNAAALTLFRKEASALHNLYHQAIVRYFVFTVDRTLGVPYLAMEYVAGEPLTDLLARGPLPIEQLRVLQCRLADGLGAAHELGIVHRDVSPDNVILPDGEVGRAKIIDFGIARSTLGHEGTVIGDGFAGKYGYVSPEQLGLYGGDVTGQSDIYSLGLVLVEAALGRRLDMGGTHADVIDKRRVVPDLSGVDPRLKPLFHQMLQPDPKNRPASMAEIARCPPFASEALREPPERRGGRTPLYAGLGLVGLGLAGAAALFGPGLVGTGRDGTAAQAPASREAPAAQRAPASQGATASTAPAPPARTEPQRQPTAPQPSAGSADLSEVAAPPVSAPPPVAASGRESSPTAASPAGRNEAEPVAVPVAPPTAAPLVTPAQVPPSQVSPSPAPSQQAAVTSNPPTAAAAPPREANTMERVADFIRAYQGGACFFVTPIAVSAREAQVEGLGASAAPFEALDAAFKRELGFEANIHLRQVTSQQCPLVDLLAARIGGRGARVPKLAVTPDLLRPGEDLTGTVDLWADAQAEIFLVNDEGLAQNVTRQVRRSGDTLTFRLRADGPVPRGGSKPELVVAVAGSRPLTGLRTATASPVGAERLVRDIAAEIARPGSDVSLAVRYVKVAN